MSTITIFFLTIEDTFYSYTEYCGTSVTMIQCLVYLCVASIIHVSVQVVTIAPMMFS